MRKWIFLLALTVALSLFGLLPSKSQDVAALLPCQTLLVSQRNGTVCIAAEEGLMGTGRDWDAALQALHDTAPGELFLGTVSTVVFADSAVGLIPIVMEEPELRPAARVCVTDDGAESTEVEALTKFLTAHTAGLTLANLRTATAEGESREIPRLYRMDGRYRLGQNVGPAAA